MPSSPAEERSIKIDLGASLVQPEETSYSLVDLSEAMIRDLADGIVPRVIQSMAIGCLSWADEEDRQARAAAQKAKRKKSA